MLVRVATFRQYSFQSLPTYVLVVPTALACFYVPPRSIAQHGSAVMYVRTEYMQTRTTGRASQQADRGSSVVVAYYTAIVYGVCRGKAQVVHSS